MNEKITVDMDNIGAFIQNSIASFSDVDTLKSKFEDIFNDNNDMEKLFDYMESNITKENYDIQLNARKEYNEIKNQINSYITYLLQLVSNNESITFYNGEVIENK